MQAGEHKAREGVSIPWESIVELTYLNAASAHQLTPTQLEGLAKHLDKHMHHLSLQVCSCTRKTASMSWTALIFKHVPLVTDGIRG